MCQVRISSEVPYSGKFSRFSRAEQSTRNLKLGETPMHRYFTCKACGGRGFLALKRESYNCENFFGGLWAIQRKFPAIYGIR